MNPKIKKATAIVGLVFMGLFLVSMFMFLVWQELLGGRLWLVALICFGVAVVSFCGIYFTRGFPSQQAKEAEMVRLREEYERKMAKEAAAKEGGEAEQDSGGEC
ncbi:MAG: hypothetical protein FWE84_03680 [Firmicutes bacterium]|nr:hypothetical protein [Bacillota bacterium]